MLSLDVGEPYPAVGAEGSPSPSAPQLTLAFSIIMMFSHCHLHKYWALSVGRRLGRRVGAGDFADDI